MSERNQKTANIVLLRIRQISDQFGISESSVCSYAFKQSRAAARLEQRDRKDEELLAKLDALEVELQRKRMDKAPSSQGFAVDHSTGRVTVLDEHGCPVRTGPLTEKGAA